MPKNDPNKDGYYRETFYYQGKRYDIRAKDEKALYRKVAEKQIELESGNVVMNKNTTVSRWCDEWLEVYKKPKVGERHYTNLEILIRLHVKPEIGVLKLTDIRKINLQKLLNRHEGGSYSQVSRLRSCLYELFDNAVEEDLIVKNPARKLSLPNYTQGERIAFTDAEYGVCLEVAKTHRAGAWILTMLTCGLRPQETIPLLWSDIDLKERLIKINKAADVSHNQAKVKDTKTNAGNRIVCIKDELYQALKTVNKKSIYVFPKADGGMMTATSAKRLWKSFIRTLDIHMGAKLYRNAIQKSKLQEGLTPYSCRHTCITRLVLAGVDVKTVQTFAGHESAETTLKFYTHLDKETAAKRILYFNESGSNGGTNKVNADK